MKKFVSFLLAVILIFTFCAPAFAMSIGKAPPIAETGDLGDLDSCRPIEGKIIIQSGNFFISENYEIDELSISSGCILLIPEGRTLTVKGTFENSGTVELLGTLDIKECSVKNGVDKINIGNKGNLITSASTMDIGRVPPIVIDDRGDIGGIGDKKDIIGDIIGDIVAYVLQLPTGATTGDEAEEGTATIVSDGDPAVIAAVIAVAVAAVLIIIKKKKKEIVLSESDEKTR